MKIVSVNVAQPSDVEYRGKLVRSSIWKKPVEVPVRVDETNLAGDRQATAIIHGGIHKAVYVFGQEQYAWWKRELQRDDLTWGMFGENLTVSGLNEADVRLGDTWGAGTAQFSVTGPRIPCSNLAMRFNDSSVPLRFSEHGHCGVYLRVLETGTIRAGDRLQLLQNTDEVTIQDLFRAVTRPRQQGSAEKLKRAMLSPFIDPELVTSIKRRLHNQTDQSQ